MIAMQYNIPLPSDYDMQIIRDRVRDNGSKTDGFEELALKAYLVAEKAKYGNSHNEYAPFYLWESTSGMNQFLLGGPFNNILDSYGWPSVPNWIVLHQHVTKPQGEQYAVVQKVPITVFSDFENMCANEQEGFENWVGDSATSAYISAYNPQDWELCRMLISTDLAMLKKIARAGYLVYDVLHMS